MALNLNRAARAHAASDMEAGKKYTKEELADQWLTIERVGLVDKDQVKHGKPVLDPETGEVVHMTWGQFRFKEIPDGYLRGFGELTRMVCDWVDEAEGDIDAVNEELANNPIKIRIKRPVTGNYWQFEVE